MLKQWKKCSYNWPNNLDQLQHVLKELVTITKTPYISCDTVEAILKQEPDYGRVFDDSVKFDGTLDEINYQIILQVLHEEHDNKEKNRQAARHKPKHTLADLEEQ